MSKDFINDVIHDMARKAIYNNTIFEYMLYWQKESSGWQKMAKRILHKELKKAII